MKTVLTVGACALALAVSVSASGRSTLVSCQGSQLQGTFAVVPGSAGAGNITYALRLRNTSKTTCQLTGLPQGRLLGRRGAKLPTLVRAAFPGALAAVLVTLSPGSRRGRRRASRRTCRVPARGRRAAASRSPTRSGSRGREAGRRPPRWCRPPLSASTAGCCSRPTDARRPNAHRRLRLRELLPGRPPRVCCCMRSAWRRICRLALSGTAPCSCAASM